MIDSDFWEAEGRFGIGRHRSSDKL
jgi:hypothetical protein